MEKYLPSVNKLPIIEKIKSSCPPEELYHRFSDNIDSSFLHSSMKTGSERYSFIGIEPFLVLKAKNSQIQLRFNGHEINLRGNPFGCIGSIINTYKIENRTPLPFIAGGIGYFSYDLKDVLENFTPVSVDDLLLPDAYFVFYRALVIHDSKKPEELYISILDMDTREHAETSRLLGKIKKLINTFPRKKGKSSRNVRKQPVFISNFTKDGYLKATKRVIDYIKAGDIYQACLSQRFMTRWDNPPYELYLKLGTVNPAPFSAYLNFEDLKVISSSPELFLRVRGDSVETRPMKGTRARGGKTGENNRIKKELLESAKDDAELSMIVDLERNDLGRISVPGSVKVDEHRRIETYPTVFQTISVIKSKREKDAGLVEIIKAAFPGGSISGCPKIRAMEIIDELEPTRRSLYTGSIGYISFHDTMDLNIAIRTMILKGQDVYFQAGGGIVVDSDPESEYRETLDKAKALMLSI